MERDDLNLIADGLDRILSDAPLTAIDGHVGQGAEAKTLWATFAEQGYPKLCANEAQEGFGGAIADIIPLAVLGARHALAVPLVDTMLATGLLSAAGLDAPEGRIGLLDPQDAAAPLAYAAQLDFVLTLKDSHVRCHALNRHSINHVVGGEDGEGTLTAPLSDAQMACAAPDWLSPLAMRALAALMRAAQMAGAMQMVLDLTLSYTQEREQFGRPLARFQAIQHHLSDIACETAAAIAAVELAGDALQADPACGTATLEDIAIAKLRCGEAASRVAAAAHQAHGAMGFTREYALGRYTRRLWQWQDQFGSSTYWAGQLGRAVLAEAEPSLWPRITR